MRILVTDAFCSSNRGDAAILDGLIGGLRRRLDAEVTVTSHFPAVAKHFHGVEALADGDVVGVARAIDRADLVVGCGGSYLHDLYAGNLHPRLATIHACARVGKPFVVFGQSIGPLDSPLSRTAARNALEDATWICVRDDASARTVRGLGVTTPLHVGVDAAVVGKVTPGRASHRAVLGVTVRGWHFPSGGTQAAYEDAVVAAVSAWQRQTGETVRFLANCTSFGGYAQDDRVAARRVAAQLGPWAEVVEDDALPFDVVRGQAGACDLFLGTRMHSLLFATTAGVPAVGVAYEFKTGEWLEQVGLGGAWVPIEAPTGLTEKVLDAWARRDEQKAAVEARLPELRAKAEEQLDRLVELARGARPRVEARAAGRRSWDEETWRYDRPHRRLRAVVDTVLAEAPRGRVLDLGCSSGLLGRMLGRGYDYTGLDVAPSVAAEEPGFVVKTAGLDDAWPVEGPFDVVVASGSLEYVSDVEEVVRRARALLPVGGLAVLTLFNLAHVSRKAHAHRHMTWRFMERPDEFLLLLREVGLTPVRVFASSAGRGPAPAVDAEAPTDLDRTGAVQLGLPGVLRLGHHVVAVCRAGAPMPGPTRVAELANTGSLLDAMRVAVAVARDAAWSARAWSDLGVLWSLAGDAAQARACLERAFVLDPERPGLRADLDAIRGTDAPPLDAQGAQG